MREIILHTAVTDRHGARRDAGEMLVVGGDKAADIGEAEAKELVGRHGAVVSRTTSPPKRKRASAATKRGGRSAIEKFNTKPAEKVEASKAIAETAKPSSEAPGA